jgi:hypothetical protein
MPSGDTSSSSCVTSIQVHDLNKGGASDLTYRILVAMPMQEQAVSDIYTRDHSS